MTVYLDVNDIAFEDMSSDDYDLAVFACGYEERSIFFPGLFSSNVKNVLVLGFAANASDANHEINSHFYSVRSRYKKSPVLIEYSDVNKVFSCLLEAVSSIKSKKNSEFRILVDYSSMPRLWYSEILNFVKCFEFGVPVICDFVYSVGEHEKVATAKQLSEPIVLPGCGAVSTYNRETVGIFSLGFSEGGPLCLHHKIEPDRTFSLIARPGALDDYAEKAQHINKFFLNNFSNSTVYSPLTSVEQCYATLREIFYPYLGVASVVMVPFGPKPHALASILTAMNYAEVACLYSSMGGTGGAVKPTTELVISRISKLESAPYKNS